MTPLDDPLTSMNSVVTTSVLHAQFKTMNAQPTMISKSLPCPDRAGMIDHRCLVEHVLSIIVKYILPSFSLIVNHPAIKDSLIC